MKAQIWNFNKWMQETDAEKLAGEFDKLLLDSGFHVLATCNYFFQPQGFTKLWLLGESHFAIHTFPEERKTYIELSSCNELMYNKFVRLLESLEQSRGA